LVVNLYIQGSATAQVGSQKVKLNVTTDYPWDGKVVLKPVLTAPAKFDLRLRVPAWCDAPALSVNRKKVDSPVVDKGYFVLGREWKKGDVVELDLPMPVRRIIANPQVKADEGLTALQRGPLVYCVEACDNQESLASLYLPVESTLTASKEPDLLGGVVVLKGHAQAAPRQDWKARLYQSVPASRTVALKAIPYYTWDNRAAGAMQVWLPTAPPVPVAGGPEVDAKAEASAKSVQVEAVHDGKEPKGSRDHPGTLCHFWPRKGTDEWISYTWDKPMTFSGSSVYWFDDTGSGECRPPASWSIEYLDGGDWKPIKTGGSFAVDLDKWCEVKFAPVLTKGLRLKIKEQPQWAVGIHEWRVVADEE